MQGCNIEKYLTIQTYRQTESYTKDEINYLLYTICKKQKDSSDKIAADLWVYLGNKKRTGDTIRKKVKQ